MTQIYGQQVQYVIDKNKYPWIWANGNMIRTHNVVAMPARDIEHGIEQLTRDGHIESNPLEKAITSMKANIQLYGDQGERFEKILCAMYEEMK